MKGSILISDEIEELYGEAIEAAAPGAPRVVIHPDRVDGDPTTAEVAFFSNELFPDRAGEFIRPVIASVKAGTISWAGLMKEVFMVRFPYCTVIDRAFDAATRPGAHGSMQPTCAKTSVPMRSGLAGIGTENHTAPSSSLSACRTEYGVEPRSMKTFAPRRILGRLSLRSLRKSETVVLGGAWPALMTKFVLPVVCS